MRIILITSDSCYVKLYTLLNFTEMHVKRIIRLRTRKTTWCWF